MNGALLDTSYLLALEPANDQNHEAAARHWQQAVNQLRQLVITSLIFAEVVTFFNTRGYHSKAVQVGNRLLHSPSVRFVHIDAPLLLESWTYF